MTKQEKETIKREIDRIYTNINELMKEISEDRAKEGFISRFFGITDKRFKEIVRVTGVVEVGLLNIHKLTNDKK